MNLTRLTARGVHARLDFAETLDPVAVILGDNGAGKSSLLGLTRLILNGPAGATFPVLGASPAYDWEASAAFSGGLQIGRWMRGGKHAASFGGIGGGLKEVQTRIDQAVGRASTWNLDAFLADTPSKRQAFLESEVLRGAGWSCEKVWAALDAVQAPKSALAEVLDVAEPPDDSGRVLLASVLAALRDVGAVAHSDAPPAP